MSQPAGQNPLGPKNTVRTALGGVLMGVANLIPGVSGGTMILALGLYEQFIEAVADVTALRFNARNVAFLLVIGVSAAASIVLLSSVILYLLFRYSALMFALFIGLTLGGAPLLVRLIPRFSPSAIIATIAGFAVMAAVAVVKEGASMPRNTVMDLVAGIVGATTMVLPGISGSYMLLIMDQYDRIIGAIADLKHGDFASLKIIIPVGIGVGLGIVGLSNLLKWLLRRWESATLGFLLGLLLGSVLGLWPFGRAPTEKILAARSDAELTAFAQRHGIELDTGPGAAAAADQVRQRWQDRTITDYPASQVAGAVILLIAGFACTLALGGEGGKRRDESPANTQIESVENP